MINIDEKECMLCETEEATLERIIMQCLMEKSLGSTPHGPIRFFEMHFNSVIDRVKFVIQAERKVGNFF